MDPTPVVTETDAGTVVLVPAVENAAPTGEANWIRFWTALDEMRNFQRSQMEAQVMQTAMMERLVETQQQTITALSGQVSALPETLVAALATLIPPPEVVVEMPHSAEPNQDGLESGLLETQNPPTPPAASATRRKRVFL